MRKVTFAILGLSAMGAITAAPTPTSPMTISTFANPSSSAGQVRYVCNEWGRCWWRPNYRPYGYYGGPRYYGGYGGYGGWRRGWDHRW
jgi:hypothetical protein